MTPLDSDNTSDSAPLIEFLAHMHVRRRSARRIFGVIFVGGVLLSALCPAQYCATASIAVMPAPEFTVRQDAGSHAFNSASLSFDQIMEAETAILQSDDLHETTLHEIGMDTLYPEFTRDTSQHPISQAFQASLRLIFSPWRGVVGKDDPDDAALRRFSNALRVLPTKDGNVIAVSFTHSDAATSARTLNVMLNRYAERRRHIYDDPQLGVAQRETDMRAGAVLAADRALQSFKARAGFSDYDAEREMMLKRRSQAAQSLADAHAMQAQSEARVTALSAQISSLPKAAPLYQENDTDTRLQALDDSLTDLRGRVIAAREHYREGSHLLNSLETQIRAREVERVRMADIPFPSVVRAGRSPVLDPLLLARAQAIADRDAARSQAEYVQREIKTLSTALQGLDADEETLADLTRRKEAAQDAYANSSRAASEQRLIEAEDARRLANVRIIQPARVPQHQTLTKLFICLAGLIVGAACAMAWLITKFVSRTTFLTGPGLEHASQLPVLAVFESDPAHAA